MSEDPTKTATRWWRTPLRVVAGFCAYCAALYYVPGLVFLMTAALLLLSLFVAFLLVLAAYSYRAYETIIGVAVKDRRSIMDTIEAWLDCDQQRECRR